VTSNAFIPVGAWIVHIADKPLAIALIRGCDARLPLRRRFVRRAIHAQGFIDRFMREVIQAFAFESFDDFTEDDVADIGVDEFGVDGCGEFEIADVDPGLLSAIGVIAQVIVGGEAAAMQEQMLDGDFVFAVGCEFGQVFGDGVGEGELAALGEDHDGGGGGDDFGERSEIENSVRRHRGFGRLDGAHAEGFAIDDFVLVADEQDCAWDIASGDGGFDEPIGVRHVIGVEGCSRRRCVNERLGSRGGRAGGEEEAKQGQVERVAHHITLQWDNAEVGAV